MKVPCRRISAVQLVTSYFCSDSEAGWSLGGIQGRGCKASTDDRQSGLWLQRHGLPHACPLLSLKASACQFCCLGSLDSNQESPLNLPLRMGLVARGGLHIGSIHLRQLSIPSNPSKCRTLRTTGLREKRSSEMVFVGNPWLIARFGIPQIPERPNIKRQTHVQDPQVPRLLAEKPPRQFQLVNSPKSAQF